MSAHPHLSTYSHLLENHHQVGATVPARLEIRDLYRESHTGVAPISVIEINHLSQPHVADLIFPVTSRT